MRIEKQISFSLDEIILSSVFVGTL